MKNKKFLNYINEYKLACEGIGNIAKQTISNVIPTSQNIKKAQQGDSLIGRTVQQLSNIHDTLVNLGQASEQGDLKGIIGAINTGVDKHAEMKAKWANRQYILSQNFLKDIKRGDIFIVNKKDELLYSLIDLYPSLKKYIPNELELEVTHIEKVQYNDFHNDNFNQLWGKFYTLPKEHDIYTKFNDLNIGGLFISFNAEVINNVCYCTWVDNNLNPIASLQQITKNVKKESDGKYSLTIFKGADVGNIINDFLNIINQTNPLSKKFFLVLNDLANTIAMQKRRLSGQNINNELFKLWSVYFNNHINKNDKRFSNLKITDKITKDYFQLSNNIPINVNIDKNTVINVRLLLDEIIKSGSI